MMNNIYPSTLDPNLSRTTIIRTEEETNAFIECKLSAARVAEMEMKNAELKKDLKRYRKIMNRWSRADVGIKVVGIVLAATGAVAGVLVGTTTGPLLIPVLAPIVGALTASETILTGGLVIGLTSRRKAYYREKCNLIRSYIDRMYILTEKCKQDGVITLQELETFRSLMDEYYNAVNGIKVTPFDFDKLNKDIKKELQKELVEEMKVKQKSQLRSQLAAAYSNRPPKS